MALHDHLIGNADKQKIQSTKVIDSKVNISDYEEVPELAIGGSKYAVDIWVRLGRPTTPFSVSGAKLVDALITMWQELYPAQAKDWYATRAEYQKAELDVQEQVRKETGGSLASYPLPLFQMMKKVFPTIKLGERETCKKMIRKWPMFRMSQVR